MKFPTRLAASAAVVIFGAQALSASGREADRAARPEAEASGPSSAYQRASYTSPRSDEAYSPRRAVRDDGVTRDGASNVGWAANRRHSASENAQYQFGKNGADFASGSVDAYVAKAHAFLSAPPRGVLKASRSNGDVLFYDPKGNVFVVADKGGAPRTMFKPRDGMAYWTQQKQRLADGSGRRASSGSSDRSGDAEG